MIASVLLGIENILYFSYDTCLLSTQILEIRKKKIHSTEIGF